MQKNQRTTSTTFGIDKIINMYIYQTCVYNNTIMKVKIKFKGYFKKNNS